MMMMMMMMMITVKSKLVRVRCSIEFCENRLNSFCVILLTNKQVNKMKTNFLAEVIPQNI